ncbi:MAG: ISAs1 family transposase [Nitrospirae bacterium]|nr:ISAs1 family transposase [Nitrospirota bacterium]
MLPNPRPYFEGVPDPRRETNNKLHGLSDILCITLCAVISGCDDWESVAEFGESKREWFGKFLTLSNGIPSHDTFRRVFSLIDSEKFEEAFSQWASQSGVIAIEDEHIALDGKTVRRSRNGKSGRALHLLHAWSCSRGLVAGQLKVDDKSNEITAIPDVLSLFDLKGITVTIDAMGCQRDIAQHIVSSDGNYILALKGNQGDLLDDVKLFLDTETKDNPKGAFKTVEKDHGRIETRKVWVSEDIDWLDKKKQWAGLKSIVVVEANREIQDKKTKERRYFISSLPAEAKRLGTIIRAHWGIENSLHYVLDVAFNEDQCRARTGHNAENLSIIRRFALNLLKQNKTCMLGVKNKRLKAAYDDTYRASILNLKYLS